MENFNLSRHEANEGRKERVSKYRSILNLAEDFEVTEDNIDDWGVAWVANRTGAPYDRVRAEILGQRWSNYEEN